jgi:hypothetical protein
LQDAVRNYAPDISLRIIDVDVASTATSADANKKAVEYLKATKFKYFLSTLYQIQDFMEEAGRQGIAGTGEHEWMITGAAAAALGKPGVPVDYEKGSALHLALRGITQFFPVGALPQVPSDGFLQLIQAFRKLQSSAKDKEYIRSKLPQYPDAPDFFNLDDPDFFRVDYLGGGFTELWTFDAVIAAGLAACNITRNSGTYFNGPEHYGAIKRTSFVGSTGQVRFDQRTGSRDPTTTLFGIRNWQEIGETAGNVSIVDIYTYVFQDNQFVPLAPHKFSDGTTEIPKDLAEVDTDMNYIGKTLRIIGLAMSGIVVALSVFFSGWTHLNRKEHVIKASQPIFLHIICLGALVMGVSIIPLSLDDEVVDTDVKSVACMAVPWLFGTGFGVGFSSLFSKTWRINKLFHSPGMRRVKVTERDVMAPVVAVTGGKQSRGNPAVSIAASVNPHPNPICLL